MTPATSALHNVPLLETGAGLGGVCGGRGRGLSYSTDGGVAPFAAASSAVSVALSTSPVTGRPCSC